MKCYYCDKEMKDYDFLQGKKACFSCIIAAEESMGISREELYEQNDVKDVDCLYCGTTMEQGFVNIHGTFLGAMLAGFSWLNCYFQPMRRRKEYCILGRFQKKAALFCPNCEAVHIRGID